MLVADMHCDTISELWLDQKAGKPGSVRNGRTMVTLEKMKQGGYLLQNFAVFVQLDRTEDPLEAFTEMADLFDEQMEKNQDLIRPARSYEDIERNREEGRMSGLLTVEEGAVIRGNVSLLREIYRRGVRMMTLTWNFENELGYPHLCSGDANCGLKEKGIEAVLEMEKLGIIVDVSHLSDEGFWDVVHYTEKPFVASHSDARAVCGHSRNMTDEMIRTLADRGGVMGINFCDEFLGPDPDGTLEEMAEHICHIRNLGGIGCIGLGSDFDGISNTPEIRDPSDMPKLIQTLDRKGFTEREIESVMSGNVLRVYKEILS